MKFDVWTAAIEPPKRATKEFTTPTGRQFSLTLEEGDITHAALARQHAARLIGVYVTGSENQSGAPATFPPVGGRRVVITDQLCLEAGGVAAHQPANLPDSERWEPHEIIALGVQCGPQWARQVLPWISEVTGGGRGAERDLGNASPAPEANSSSPLAPETASIHTLRSAETPSSGASTSDSENSLRCTPTGLREWTPAA